MAYLLRVDQSYDYAKAEPFPEVRLLIAIIVQAIADLRDRRRQGDALAFLEGEDCASFCDMLGWDMWR